MTYEQRPFNNVIYHGKVMLDGKEMSKSKGIVVSPEEAIEKYGRDVLRFFILSGDPSDDLNFTWDKMEENQEFMNILWNTYNYKETYTEERERPDNLNIEDKWILSRLNTLVKDIRDYSTEPDYEAFKAAQELERFTKEDLSRGYIKMIRDRLRPGYEGDDRAAAEWTLQKVTDELLQVMSPFLPYLAEHLYSGEKDSIHMLDYPEADEEFIDEALEREMTLFQDIEEAVARLRQEKGVKLRHPVKKVTVSGNAEVREAVESLEDLFEERLNTKEVTFEKVELDYEVKLDYAKAGPELGGDVKSVESSLAEMDHDELAEKIEAGESIEVQGHELSSEMFEVRTFVPEGMEGEEFSEGTVYIDDEMTEGLKDEALVAEVLRELQQARKEAELDVEDKVDVSFGGDIKPLQDNLEEIKDRVNVASVDFKGLDLMFSGEVEFEGRKVEYSFSEPVE